jgi:group I intron endonuclease
MINFVYITTNLINGKQYVGDHSTNDLNCSKTQNYFGSGSIILKAIKKYGKQNFSRKILEYCDSKKISFISQQKYIEQYNTLEPNGYNISPTGGLHVSNCHSNLTKKRISKSNTGKKRSDESRKQMSDIAKNRKFPSHYNPISDKQKNVIIYLHLMFNRGIHEISCVLNISKNSIKNFLQKQKYYKGRIYSQESKDKLSIKRKGIKRSPEVIIKMSNKLKGKIPWNKGLTKETDKRLIKKQSSLSKEKTYEELYGENRAKEIKINIKSSNKGKKRTKIQRQNISNSLKGKKHTENHKRKNSQSHMGISSPNKGKHYFIDENGVKKIKK